MIPTEEECIRILLDEGCSYAVVEHCKKVKKVAKRIGNAIRNNGHNVFLDVVIAGALLHDLGRGKTHGLMHAIVGAEIARKRGIDERICNIIERHIGGGLDEDDAKMLGLPIKNYIPQTIEEKIVCHADNLSGKEKLKIDDALKPYIERKLDKTVKRIKNLHLELSELCGRNLDEI